MSYIGNVGHLGTSINSDVSKYTYEYIATAGQTVFTGADINSATLGYTVGNIIVTYGGADLAYSDYVATDGVSIVLTDGALVGKIIRIVAFQTFEIADVYTKGQADVLLDGKAVAVNTHTKVESDALYKSILASEGGPSLGPNSFIRTNAQVISEDISFTGTENGMTVGPITVDTGVTITVAPGSTWVIL
jgi:hypothetical protein